MILATDYDNWSVMYMCKQRYFGYRKQEWVWILSRNSELDDAQLQEATDALK